MLKFYLLLTVALPLAQATRILLTNDDGWDHPNIRALFNVLDTTTTNNHNLMLCAPEFGHTEPPWREIRPAPYHIRPLRPEGVPEPATPEGVPESAPLEEAPEDRSSSTDDDNRTLFDDDLSDADTLFEDDRGLSTSINPQLADRHRQVWDWGYNVSDLRLNHVPFDPASAIYLGERFLGPVLWQQNDDRLPDGRPVLVLVGPTVRASSRADAHRPDRAVEAIQRLALDGRSPSIAFTTANTIADPSREDSSKIFAQLAIKVIQRLTKHERPDIPSGGYLNVSFPYVDVRNERCHDVNQFKFILSSNKENDHNLLNRALCKQNGFPFETHVVNRDDGCYVAISLNFVGMFAGLPTRMLGHAKMIRKLKPILKCLPDN